MKQIFGTRIFHFARFIQKKWIVVLAGLIIGGIVQICPAQGLSSSGTEFWLGFFPMVLRHTLHSCKIRP